VTEEGTEEVAEVARLTTKAKGRTATNCSILTDSKSILENSKMALRTKFRLISSFF
jgi:hypothetical protein